MPDRAEPDWDHAPVRMSFPYIPRRHELCAIPHAALQGELPKACEHLGGDTEAPVLAPCGIQAGNAAG